jgi:hypothetical protein
MAPLVSWYRDPNAVSQAPGLSETAAGKGYMHMWNSVSPKKAQLLEAEHLTSPCMY